MKYLSSEAERLRHKFAHALSELNNWSFLLFI